MTTLTAAAPIEYFQVAAPLIIVLLVIIFLQVRSLEMYEDFAEREDLPLRFRLFAAGAAAVALVFLALIISGEVAALKALQHGPTSQREDAVDLTLKMELALVGAGITMNFATQIVKAERRHPGLVYLGTFALFLGLERWFISRF